MSIYNKLIALRPSLTPADFLDHIRLQDDGGGPYIKSWSHPTIARPTDQEIAAAEPAVAVPQEVTMRQARLALLGAGLLAGVDAAIAALDSPTKEAATIEWEYAATVERNSALVTTLAGALDLDVATLDALFVAAAAL